MGQPPESAGLRLRVARRAAVRAKDPEEGSLSQPGTTEELYGGAFARVVEDAPRQRGPPASSAPSPRTLRDRGGRVVSRPETTDHPETVPAPRQVPKDETGFALEQYLEA